MTRLPACLAWATLALTVLAAPLSRPTNRPIVLWHGLGDSYDASGLRELADEFAAKRNTSVHVIALAEDGGADRCDRCQRFVTAC
jgi:palmitoyl-protein thioesterase